jgi:hypothetical protein
VDLTYFASFLLEILICFSSHLIEAMWMPEA